MINLVILQFVDDSNILLKYYNQINTVQFKSLVCQFICLVPCKEINVHIQICSSFYTLNITHTFIFSCKVLYATFCPGVKKNKFTVPINSLDTPSNSILLLLLVIMKRRSCFKIIIQLLKCFLFIVYQRCFHTSQRLTQRLISLCCLSDRRL